MNKIFRALLIVAGVSLLLSPFAVGTPEYAKKEGLQCLACHTAVGKADLNDAGRYYKDHKTLEGYKDRRP